MVANGENIERRIVEEMFIVFHPEAGLMTTEPYEEKAEQRALQLIEKHGGKCYVIVTPKIMRVDGPGKYKRLYKIEKDRLHIEQETL